ncbi:lpxD [Wigglesworthia glossinidia endosymbiont of Glossina brevipalpis]|uniref:UDP-3-O-(3-hydroxymyristoyl)glucosamine N-acyltransferase n=1 Tax=Wigglesworthia glossinidia brevipalpis TaxID=36870 RepID=LPXD_WIGBR|nr:RecName: Full=UDP-3-O-(3-hydroxymyristoyl)glucosamine N-acyltransferase; Short=UDP-3-O-(3-OHC14)-GlcN N-acyltransferase; AltName: Full=UDP-3-O-(3-hydroxytetradecanoyl)glucosamine N-acyltransferase [Wigglesworthia glossinidia endosymbiont of Glossina brevipalpis]BAC24528.1 lpxD [Wigglesworthia glossinidia endosymbiont of Glossina brevipalpis]
MLEIKLSDVSKIISAKLYGDKNFIIKGISSIEDSKPGYISFIYKNKFRKYLPSCKASAIILAKDNLPFCKQFALVVKDPYIAYVKLVKFMYVKKIPKYRIRSTAIVSKKAILGKNIYIGHNTVIESKVKLENNIIIGSGCFIGENTIIGSNTHLWDNTTIHHGTIIGNNCSIQSGSVIGSDGFGYANKNGSWIKIPHLGKVVIGNNVEIGSSTTIDRGSIDNTVIGNGVIIDNQCQIAHNVIIGENTAIAGGVVMAGSLIIGSNCIIGGASVINGHIIICDRVKITGMSMVMRSIKTPGIYSSGVPAQLNKKWKKNTALIMNINKIKKQIKEILKKYKKK